MTLNKVQIDILLNLVKTEMGGICGDLAICEQQGGSLW